jgi:hypothetical protein
MSDFATIGDVIALFRALTPEETAKAESLLPIVSARLREEAVIVGKDLDQMITDDTAGNLAIIAKQVTVDVVARALMTSTEDEPATQSTESAGGYSQSITYLVPGGGLFIKKAELAQLGLRRQQVRHLDL